MATLEAETDRRVQLVDTTDRVEEEVAAAGVGEAACVLRPMRTPARPTAG